MIYRPSLVLSVALCLLLAAVAVRTRTGWPPGPLEPATRVSGVLRPTADDSSFLPLGAPAGVQPSCPALTIALPTGAGGAVGVVSVQMFSADGGTAPYMFSVASGTLPTGLTLAPAGVLSGTPTTAGTSRFTLRAADAKTCAGTRAYTLTVAPPLVIPGIMIQPGQAIQSIVSAAPIPSVFILKAGVHRLQTIRPRSGDTFTGEAGTILSGAKVLTAPTGSGPWAYGGQTQQGAYDDGGGEACLTGHPACGNPEDLFIDNVIKEHVSTFAEGAPGKWFFDYGADVIYIWDNPTGHVVETGVTPTAFENGVAINVTIRNLIVEKYATLVQNATVKLGAGWLLTGAEVRWNHYAGIETLGPAVVRANNIHHNGAFGLIGSGMGALIDGNEIAYNNIAFASPWWGAGGSKWVYTDGLTVRGNFSHHNIGPGLWTDINNIRTVYENNIVEDNVRGGIFHEISYDAIIRNNTVRRNGTAHLYPGWPTEGGIGVSSSRNVEIYGNTLEDNWAGIGALHEVRTDNLKPLYGLWQVVGLNVHDNNVRSLANLGAGCCMNGVVWGSGGLDPFDAAHNNHFSNNHYVLGSSANYFEWQGGPMNEMAWQALGNDTPGGTFTRSAP